MSFTQWNVSACDSYSLPAHVRPHVELITPTLHFDAKIPNAPASIPLKRADPSLGAARLLGQPGVGIFPKTTGTVSNVLNQLENCDQQITPDCLRALYMINYTPVRTAQNSYGIGECSRERCKGLRAYLCISGIHASSIREERFRYGICSHPEAQL